MSYQKIFKKGETLIKEGEKGKNIFLISSGLVSVCLIREKKNIEIYRAGTGHVIGDEALLAGLPSPYSVIALNDTEVFEAPADLIKQQMAALSQLPKALIKGLLEKQKVSVGELKKIKLELDDSPCPPDNVSKVFGVIYHVANTIGQKKDQKVTVAWPAFKKYAQRIFLESSLRLEQAMYLLVKLKLAEKQMVKSETDPNAPEELGFFHILDLSAIERFFDFYQNFHYKPGCANYLKYDEKCMQLAVALLKATDGEKSDQKGAVLMNYKDTLEKLKASFGPSFSPDAIDRLEQKGLFVKRQSSAKGGTISFLKTEFEIMIQNWKILKEIDKWNELGQVDLTEPKDPKGAAAAGAAGIVCPSCSAVVAGNQKFCGECGHKLAQAA